MKKVLSLLFVMLLCISLAACGEKISTQNGAGVETDDKGRPVKNTYYDASGNVTSVETIEYNEQGRRHLVITYDAQNTEIRRSTYTYHSDGYIHTEEILYANPAAAGGIARSVWEYSEGIQYARNYDAAGQLVSEYYNEDGVCSWQTDYVDGKFDSKTYTTITGNDTKLEQQLREDGSVITETLYQYGSSGKIALRTVEYGEDGSILIVTEWDEEEQMDKVVWHLGEGPMLPAWWVKDGDIKKARLPLENGEYVEFEVTDPEYSLKLHRGSIVGYDMMDAQGNMLEAVELDPQTGNPVDYKAWDSDGNLTKDVDYFEDGTVSQESFYNDAGKIHETVIYNRSGEVVLIYNCKGTDKYISTGYDDQRQEDIIWLKEGDNVTLEQMWFRNGIITQKHLFTAGNRTGMILFDAAGQTHLEVSVTGDPRTNYLGDIKETEEGGFYYFVKRAKMAMISASFGTMPRASW